MLLNRPRAIAWLTECRLDAVVATSWVNVLYLTGYYLWLQPVFKAYMASPGAGDELARLFGVVTSKGTSRLILDKNCELNAAEFPMADRFVYGPDPPVVPAESPGRVAVRDSLLRTPHRFPVAIEALVAAIKAEGMTSGSIGVEMSGLSPEDRIVLQSALPRAELLDAGNLLRIVRMVKSDEEVRRLRRAAEINELAANESLALAAPGCQLQDLAAAYRSAAAREGADFDHFAFSQQGVGFATESSYPVSERETIYIDFGCNYKHYLSDAGVTLAVGSFPEFERRTHQTLVDSIQTGAEQLIPGQKASSVQAAMMRLITQSKIASCFVHGHGIGLELRDHPILVPDSGRKIRDGCIELPADLPLESGMVINLEAPLFEFGGAAFQIEQTYLVTAQGGVPLTNRDLSIPRLAPH